MYFLKQQPLNLSSIYFIFACKRLWLVFCGLVMLSATPDLWAEADTYCSTVNNDWQRDDKPYFGREGKDWSYYYNNCLKDKESVNTALTLFAILNTYRSSAHIEDLLNLFEKEGYKDSKNQDNICKVIQLTKEKKQELSRKWDCIKTDKIQEPVAKSPQNKTTDNSDQEIKPRNNGEAELSDDSQNIISPEEWKTVKNELSSIRKLSEKNHQEIFNLNKSLPKHTISTSNRLTSDLQSLIKNELFIGFVVALLFIFLIFFLWIRGLERKVRQLSEGRSEQSDFGGKSVPILTDSPSYDRFKDSLSSFEKEILHQHQQSMESMHEITKEIRELEHSAEGFQKKTDNDLRQLKDYLNNSENQVLHQQSVDRIQQLTNTVTKLESNTENLSVLIKSHFPRNTQKENALQIYSSLSPANEIQKESRNATFWDCILDIRKLDTLEQRLSAFGYKEYYWGSLDDIDPTGKGKRLSFRLRPSDYSNGGLVLVFLPGEEPDSLLMVPAAQYGNGASARIKDLFDIQANRCRSIEAINKPAIVGREYIEIDNGLWRFSLKSKGGLKCG